MTCCHVSFIVCIGHRYRVLEGIKQAAAPVVEGQAAPPPPEGQAATSPTADADGDGDADDAPNASPADNDGDADDATPAPTAADTNATTSASNGTAVDPNAATPGSNATTAAPNATAADAKASRGAAQAADKEGGMYVRVVSACVTSSYHDIGSSSFLIFLALLHIIILPTYINTYAHKYRWLGLESRWRRLGWRGSKAW